MYDSFWLPCVRALKGEDWAISRFLDLELRERRLRSAHFDGAARSACGKAHPRAAGVAACRVALRVGAILLSTMLGLGTRAVGGTPGVGSPDANYDRAVRPILSQALRRVPLRRRVVERLLDRQSGHRHRRRRQVRPGRLRRESGTESSGQLRGTLKPRMPLHGKMDQNEIARIEDWIRNLPPDVAEVTDAKPWRWPFEKPVKVTTAGRSETRLGFHADRRADPREAREGFFAWPRATGVEAGLARRVYVDLIGMPPSPGGAECLSRRRLARGLRRHRSRSPTRYGERRGWRLALTSLMVRPVVCRGDGATTWRYRDRVIEALNRDMPYDRFVIQQLAARLAAKPGSTISPTFRGTSPDWLPSLVGLLEQPRGRSGRQNYLNQVTDATGSIFLGLDDRSRPAS